MAPGGGISIQVVHVMFTVISTGYHAFLLEPGFELNPCTAMKQVFYIISLEPINKWSMSKSFHEPSVKLVRFDMIGTFWRATMRELYGQNLNQEL